MGGSSGHAPVGKGIKMGSLLEQTVSQNSTWIETVALYVLPSIVLMAGVIDDLRSRKVHNPLIVALFGCVVVFQFLAFGAQGILSGFLALGVALGLSAPMVLTGMLGGGDMKLYAVFAVATNITITLWVGVYSLVWGALFGVLVALAKGHGTLLIMNVAGLLKRQRPAEAHLTKIPFTVALLFGWMTYLSLSHWGGR